MLIQKVKKINNTKIRKEEEESGWECGHERDRVGTVIPFLNLL